MTIWQKIKKSVSSIGVIPIVIKTFIYVGFILFAIFNVDLPFLKHSEEETVDFSFIMDLCVLIIGILLGILTIVATSDVPITNEFERSGKADTFIVVIATGIIECLGTIIIIILDFGHCSVYQYILFALTANVLFDFIYFLILTIQMCRYNIKKSAKKEIIEQQNIDVALADLQQIRTDVEKLKNQKLNKNQENADSTAP